jgi:hypothetical protein
MTIIIKLSNANSDIDRFPDHCPMCHHGIMPEQIGGSLISREPHQGDTVQGFFVCPRKECQRAFIGIYKQTIDNRATANGTFKLKFAIPTSPQPREVSEEIDEISPEYKKVLAQSSSAEAYNLDQIAGMGYRKALEYLIKDYCCHKYPDQIDAIKSQFLSNCINNFVDDSNVKECSKRASWLGNDETHYVRKWENKDIKDLKKLLRLTEAWIDNNLLTEKYLADMQ